MDTNSIKKQKRHEKGNLENGDTDHCIDFDGGTHRHGNNQLHGTMRQIMLIIIHCSAVRPDQTSSAAQINTWHHRQGWKLGIGYHYVVRRNGQIEPGRPEYMVGAHCKNHNQHSIGLDIRGQPADARTEAQKVALRQLLEELHRRYPSALIVGHHDLNPHKACPCIADVAREYAELQPQ